LSGRTTFSNEEVNVSGYFQISTRNALRAAIDYLMQLREERLNQI
jgi:hypothetical protein